MFSIFDYVYRNQLGEEVVLLTICFDDGRICYTANKILYDSDAMKDMKEMAPEGISENDEIYFYIEKVVRGIEHMVKPFNVKDMRKFILYHSLKGENLLPYGMGSLAWVESMTKRLY
jgi:hypothetical protein